MCGVAGIFHYQDVDAPVDRNLLARMSSLLQHRGPDGEGIFIDGPIGLAHRRLAIVDLSATGHQPMRAASGAVISYNGEAYNHRSFRPRLEDHGVTFRGPSDTETLLQLVDKYGPNALRDVAGIFAMAFWDARNKRLFLARDPLGVKQIYFHDNGRRVVFASEIKALFADASVPRAVDARGVSEYLHFHTPLFDRTFFRDVRQVRAGEYVEVDACGVRPRMYWRPDGFAPASGDAAARITELDTLLTKVVDDQLMSDVPVGAFFSGGIDSSAIASLARKRAPLRCFGVHFSDQGVIDERPFQEAAARALGVDLELTTFDGDSFPSDMFRLMYAQDQPVIGPAMLPMYYVSRLAARHVKVCMGGQAADEVFAGYARYALVEPALVVRSWFGRRSLGERVNGTPSRVSGNLRKQLFDSRNLRRLIERGSSLATWQRRYFEHVAKVPHTAWRALFEAHSFIDRIAAYDEFRSVTDRSTAERPIDKVLDWEVRTYLTGLFQQDDRMSMAHSLESRVPFADPRVVQFAFHTPAEMKLRGGSTKWILRQSVAHHLPEGVLNRRKVGFDTPAESWMRGPHRAFVRDTLLSSQARQRGITRAKAVEALLDTDDQPYWFDRVWKLLCIETWARVFLDNSVAINDEAQRPHVITTSSS